MIAKIDRLSRDAHFLLGLQKAGVKFVAADMPEANEMVVGIMALVAQAERRMISERTKAALAAAKARGQARQPEGPPPADRRDAGARHSDHHSERCRPSPSGCARCWPSWPIFGASAAAELDRRGIATARGGKWTARSIIELRARLDRRGLTV